MYKHAKCNEMNTIHTSCI